MPDIQSPLRPRKIVGGDRVDPLRPSPKDDHLFGLFHPPFGRFHVGHRPGRLHPRHGGGIASIGQCAPSSARGDSPGGATPTWPSLPAGGSPRFTQPPSSSTSRWWNAASGSTAARLATTTWACPSALVTGLTHLVLASAPQQRLGRLSSRSAETPAALLTRWTPPLPTRAAGFAGFAGFSPLDPESCARRSRANTCSEPDNWHQNWHQRHKTAEKRTPTVSSVPRPDAVFCGAGGRIRTDDLLFTKQLLYR
jgi:hypothetical protein